MRFQRRSNDQHITQAAFSVSQYFMCGVTVQALNAQIMLPTVDAVVTFFYTNHVILILLLKRSLTHGSHYIFYWKFCYRFLCGQCPIESFVKSLSILIILSL